MSNIARKTNRRALLAFLGVFGLLFIVGASLMVLEQRRLVKLEIEQSFDHEVTMLSELMLDSILRGDYVAVERLAGRWGKAHEDICAITVTAPNGFTLARYAHAIQPANSLRVIKTVAFEGRDVFVLQAEREFSVLETKLVMLSYRFTLVTMVLLLAFGWLLWKVLHRTAIIPLENEITAREHAQDSLALHSQKLESANKELETFTYSVAHDLRAPLRGIDGYSRLLLAEQAVKLDDEGRSFLQNILHATGHMSQLIDDLLAYSRLEQRDMEIRSVDTQALFESLLADCADEIKARGVAVTVAVDCPEVKADREGMTMALRNLLDNALKFTRGVSQPMIEFGVRDTGATCIVSVRDNGAGFDMKFHDQIFGIFQRLHRSEDYPGTGVGLALVKKAMERMGGRVWAESEPGKGATFYLEIPV